MNCVNGSRKKAGIDSYIWLTVADEICFIYGEDSVFCKLAKFGAARFISNTLIDINTFCSSAAPIVEEISITDFLGNGWIGKTEDIVKGAKWYEWCECIPEPTQQDCKMIFDYTAYPIPGVTPGDAQIITGTVEYPVPSSQWVGEFVQAGGGFSPCPGVMQYHIESFNPVAGERIRHTTSTTCHRLELNSVTNSCVDLPPPPPPPPPVPPTLPPEIPIPPTIQGIKGDKGDTGEQGIPGEKGDKGDKGDTGEPGIKGDAGEQGIQGIKGDKGDKGEQGIEGTPGIQGTKGDKGDTGARGDNGARGDRGDKGETGEKGEQGEQGIPGEKGDDAKVEFESIAVTTQDCLPSGEPIERITTFSVIRSDDGSTSELYRQIFDTFGRLAGSICKVQSTLDSLDLNVGIPLRGYEIDTQQCVVLYFNDQRTTKQGIGRYVNIPYPNIEAIIEWGESDPDWFTGSYYQYTQYANSKGAKVANYAPSPEIAQQQQNTLESLVNSTGLTVYYRGQPRLIVEKAQLELKLKRATYFPTALSKAGRQDGEEIFLNPERS